MRSSYSSQFSKLHFVLLFSVLAFGVSFALPLQEAHAAVTVNSVVTQTTTTILITFSGDIITEGGTTNLPADWTVGGDTPQSVTDVSGGGVSTLLRYLTHSN